MYKPVSILPALFSIAALMAGVAPATAQNFPERALTAIVPFAPGGSTDIMARSIAAVAEAQLKQNVIVKNVAGGNGSIGAKEVLDKRPDGYTILVAAENLATYRVMGVSQLSFADFEPIILLAREVPVLVTTPDSRWKTVNDLIKETKEKPDQVKIATTGPTGISGIVATILGTKFNMVPFKSAGEIVTAVLGGHTDVATVGLISAVDYVRAGKLKVLAVVDSKPLAAHADWPALGQEMPEYNKQLPWGPFYGVWVKKGTPEPVIAKLKDAFSKAAADPKFVESVANKEMLPLNLMGKAAVDYAAAFSSKTAWLLFDGGATKTSPADLGITRH
jgi:tripartite-type tricarboxylate transporter receptor subunit TctC